MSTELRLDDPRDTLKMVRETLCVAQQAVGQRDDGTDRHMDRLGRVIAEVDRQRPLGPDGKHGDRHTSTCGCAPATPRTHQLLRSGSTIFNTPEGVPYSLRQQAECVDCGLHLTVRASPSTVETFLVVAGQAPCDGGEVS